MQRLATALANTSSTGDGASSGAGDILAWTAVLVAFIGVALWIVMYARKRLLDESQTDPSGFSLSEIVEMRRAGNLSEEEYRAARDMLTGGAAAGASSKARPTERPQETETAKSPEEDDEGGPTTEDGPDSPRAP